MTLRIGRTAVAALMTLVTTSLAACAVSEQGTPDASRENRGKATARGAAAERGSPNLPEAAASGIAGSPGATKNYRGRKDPGLVPPDKGPDDDSELAVASAFYAEPTPDGKKSGIAPDYAEAVEVAIEGEGVSFRITFTFAAALPEKMPDKNTYMVVGLGMQRDGDDQSYAFGAQGTVEGWKAYGGGKTGQTRFPGEFTIQGSEMVMTIPWSYVDGPHEFEWYANSAWFQNVGNVASYLFDPIPNEPPAKFPN